MDTKKRMLMVWPAMVIAITFGIITIKSGGAVLFTDGEARIAAGDYVGFIVWFNFLAGFLYVAAGIGLWIKQQWAAKLAILIAALTLVFFAALGIHILLDGSYEIRTIVAMTLRSLIWITIAVVSTTYNKQTIHKI
ncbi:MAG: hypothetical protein KAJ39_06495 [Gammaproteobacteria bacterium]|nr:hypothetical protein [Gammaproteobacteria bacterium]